MKTEIARCEFDNEYITNFNCRISGDSVIYMNWDWPGVKVRVNGAVIFEAAEDDDLESLLAKPFKVRRVPRDGMNEGIVDNYKYKELLTEKTVRFKVFPSWTERAAEIIYNQKEGNISPLMYKRIILERRVKRDYINALSGFTLVCFEFKDIQRLNELPYDSLQYYKYNKRTGEPVCRYPADIRMLKGGTYSIMVENGYDIDLQCAKEYGGAVVIKDFR